MNSGLQIEANVTLDLCGTTCPGPIVAAKRVADELEDGQVLLLISDCPGTRDDIFAWARQTHKEVLKVEELGGKRRGFYIQKGDPWKANIVLDMRAARCPGPVVEAARLFDAMQPGEVMKLISGCKGVPGDVAAWVKVRGYTLLGSVEDDQGVYRFFIRK